MTISRVITQRIRNAGGRYWAGDNIAPYLHEGEKQLLIEELTTKFEDVLDSLIIDRANDPNSNDTGRRLAKMYINELMSVVMIQCPMQQHFPIMLRMDMMVCW